ncbi:ER membrane protein complex subunit 4 [Thelohanellus kitauei]|uniref:ER membrane protein complex subunit 4 n=1 Tax=Thelohanellus kitauei TaxID=669202 RepID=A0A0C2IQF3_THEKT|nr:ER membrane protein complex subunit 4 [Thelohanellus kitauei]
MSNPDTSVAEIDKYPVGFIKNKESVPAHSIRANEEAVDKRSWAIALEPVQALPPSALMLWMSGSKISLFPIFLIVMNLVRHVTALFNTPNVYANLGRKYRKLKMVVYFLGQLLGIMLLLYKCTAIGLLKFNRDEWVTYSYDPQPFIRESYGRTGRII